MLACLHALSHALRSTQLTLVGWLWPGLGGEGKSAQVVARWLTGSTQGLTGT